MTLSGMTDVSSSGDFYTSGLNETLQRVVRNAFFDGVRLRGLLAVNNGV